MTQALFLLALTYCAQSAPEWQPPDRSLLERLRTPLAEAIRTAEAEMKQRRAYEAEAELKSGKVVIEIEFLEDNRATEIEIDGETGKILGRDEETLKEEDRKELSKLAGALTAAKLSLREAVDLALREKKGIPYEAELELHDGKAIYEVELEAEGRYFEVTLDAMDGKVLEVGERRPVEVRISFDGGGASAVGQWLIRATHAESDLAKWEVTSDPAAPSPPHVFALTKTTSPSRTFNLAIAPDVSKKDADISVKVKAISGKEDQGGGLVWRYRDENNYYVCRVNPLEDNYRVYRVVDGVRKELASAKVDLEPGRWYALRATMQGEQIACYLDGKLMLEAKDDTFTEAGRIGLWTKADAATAFDDLAIK